MVGIWRLAYVVANLLQYVVPLVSIIGLRPFSLSEMEFDRRFMQASMRRQSRNFIMDVEVKLHVSY